MNATLYETRRGTQMRPDCDIASGHLMRFYMKVAVGKSCDLAAMSHWDMNAT